MQIKIVRSLARSASMILVLSHLPGLCWAQTLHLKEGKIVRAPIIKRGDGVITVDWFGVPVTYREDEIESITADGGETPSMAFEESAASATEQEVSILQPEVLTGPCKYTDCGMSVSDELQEIVETKPYTSPVEEEAVTEEIKTEEEIIDEVLSTKAAAEKEATEPESAPLDDGTTEEKIQQLLELSGLHRQLREVTAQMQAELDTRQHELSPHVVVAVRRLLQERFEIKHLLDAAGASLRRAYDAEKVNQVVEWLQGPLHQRMRTLEFESTSTEAEKDLDNFVTELEDSGLPEARLVLLRRLNAATRTTDASTQLTIAILYGMANVFGGADGIGQSAHPEALDKAVEEIQANPLAAEQHVLARWLFAYRMASDQELMEYIAFWESDLGHWFSKLVNQTLVRTVADACGQRAQQVLAQHLE